MPEEPAPRPDPPEEGETSWGEPGRGLHLRWLLPRGRPWCRLVVLHGYAEHSGRHTHWLRAAAATGAACGTFDFRGHGHSWGRRAAVLRWEEYLEDFDRALAGLEQTPFGGVAGVPAFLMGHSHGGLVLLAAMRAELPARGFILTNPYLRNAVPVPAWKHNAALALARIAPRMHIPNGLRSEWMTRDAGMRAESRQDPHLLSVATPAWYSGALRMQAELRASPPALRRPALIIIGEQDRVAEPEAGAVLARAWGAEATLWRRPEMRHELLRDEGREELLREMLDWMRNLAQP